MEDILEILDIVKPSPVSKIIETIDLTMEDEVNDSNLGDGIGLFKVMPTGLNSANQARDDHKRYYKINNASN